MLYCFCFCSSLIKLNSLFTVQGTTRGANVCGFISTRGKLNFHIYARQGSAYLKVWLWKLSCRLRPWAVRLKKCLNQELYEHTGDQIAQEVQVLQEAILYVKTESVVQASLKGLRVVCWKEMLQSYLSKKWRSLPSWSTLRFYYLIAKKHFGVIPIEVERIKED